MSVKSIFPSFSRQLANRRKMRVNEYQQLLQINKRQTSSLDRLACKRPKVIRMTSHIQCERNQQVAHSNKSTLSAQRALGAYVYVLEIHSHCARSNYYYSRTIRLGDYQSISFRMNGVTVECVPIHIVVLYIYDDHACVYGGENRKRVSEWKCVLVENGNDVVASGIDCLLLLLHIGMC